MKLSSFFYTIGAVIAVFSIFYFLIKIVPKIKAGNIKLREEKKQKQLEENKKLFYQIFNFLPGDGSLERYKEISMVNEIIGKLHDFFKRDNKSLENLEYLISDILDEGKLIYDEEIIIFLSTNNFTVLENVNRGIGFDRLQDLTYYARSIVLQKQNIFRQSKRVAIALGFEFVGSIVYF